MNLKHRLQRLESTIVPSHLPTAVALDVPGGPDLVLKEGQWRECADGRDVLVENVGRPVKVYLGFDPREALSVL